MYYTNPERYKVLAGTNGTFVVPAKARKGKKVKCKCRPANAAVAERYGNNPKVYYNRQTNEYGFLPKDLRRQLPDRWGITPTPAIEVANYLQQLQASAAGIASAPQVPLVQGAAVPMIQ